MTTFDEDQMGGPQTGHPNSKAIVSLILGVLAMASVVALAIMFAISPSYLDGKGGGWMLLPFFALIAGAIAAFIGSLAWIDVRRGVTHRRLL